MGIEEENEEEVRMEENSGARPGGKNKERMDQEKKKKEDLGGRPWGKKIEDLLRVKEKEGGAPAIEDVTVCSLDAEALYPSLDAIACAKLCGKLVAEASLNIVGVDYVWAGLYVALSTTQGDVNSS